MRSVRRRWCDRLQHLEQPAGIFGDRADREPLENRREDTLHHFAVLQHVGDAGRDPEVVLQDVIPAIAVADQVGPGDVAPDAPGRIQTLALLPIRLRGEYHLAGDDAVLEDFLVVVDVVDEGI